MYYNMNDIDVRSSNNFLRKVFLYMILGVGISFGTGIYLYQFNQELLISLLRYFNILLIASVKKIISRCIKNIISIVFTYNWNSF